MTMLLQELSSIQTLLDFLIDLEQKRIRSWQDELKKLPKGSLYCSVRTDGTFFYQCIDRHKYGITRDLDTVYSLARKKYLKIKIAEHKTNICGTAEKAKDISRKTTQKRHSAKSIKTNKVSKNSGAAKSNTGSFSAVQVLLYNYSKMGLDLLRITCSKSQYQWIKGNYLKNTQNTHQLKFETYSGVKVRSKSEQQIANHLELNGIPYRYEQGFEFDVSWMEEVQGATMGQYKVYFPDFTILTVTGDYILWEHLGRMDLLGYRTHNIEKIAAYRHSGSFPDSMLILTFEKDIESSDAIKKIISTRILPYVY